MTNTADGIIAFAIAFIIVGVSFVFMWGVNQHKEESAYEICIDKCPLQGFRDKYTSLKCPEMCAETTLNVNCINEDLQTKKELDYE